MTPLRRGAVSDAAHLHAVGVKESSIGAGNAAASEPLSGPCVQCTEADGPDPESSVRWMAVG
jgi:hypothetical protein